jgi:hypothetical protein
MRRRRDDEVIADLTVAVEQDASLLVFLDIIKRSTTAPRALVRLMQTSKAFNELLLRDFPEIWNLVARGVYAAIFDPLYAAHYGFFGVQLELMREQVRTVMAQSPLNVYNTEEITIDIDVSVAHRHRTLYVRKDARLVRLGDIVPLWSELTTRMHIQRGLRWFVLFSESTGTRDGMANFDIQNPGGKFLLDHWHIVLMADCLLVQSNKYGLLREWPERAVDSLIEYIRAIVVDWRKTFDGVQILSDTTLRTTWGGEQTVKEREVDGFRLAKKLFDQLSDAVDAFRLEDAQVFLFSEQDDEPSRQLFFLKWYKTAQQQRAFLIDLVTAAETARIKFDLGCSVCGAPAHFANEATGLLFCQSANCHRQNL